jgi:hypothetical protein
VPHKPKKEVIDMAERKVVGAYYQMDTSKHGSAIWIILELDNGETVRIAKRKFKKILDEAL